MGKQRQRANSTRVFSELAAADLAPPEAPRVRPLRLAEDLPDLDLDSSSTPPFLNPISEAEELDLPRQKEHIYADLLQKTSYELQTRSSKTTETAYRSRVLSQGNAGSPSKNTVLHFLQNRSLLKVKG